MPGAGIRAGITTSEGTRISLGTGQGRFPDRERLRDLRAAYKLRLRRRRLLYRAFRKRRQLETVVDRTQAIRPGMILGAGTMRNEIVRLPYFLEHHRALGVEHFLIIDNESDDGTREYLAEQSNVSLWSAKGSYKRARFGLDWLTWVMMKHAHGHWCLTLDADEILIYPFWDTRPLAALTEWLDGRGVEMFPAMMLDMYPKGPLGEQSYVSGQDPIEVLSWFDSGNYMIQRQDPMENLWIQGGVRARCFFANKPRRAPTMNKVPLVKWNRRYVYVNSTHGILPRRLNRFYDRDGGEFASGILLHTKFLDTVVDKSKEELKRREHFANSALYDEYYKTLIEKPDLWCERSSLYRGWRQLEAMGLMSRGTWL